VTGGTLAPLVDAIEILWARVTVALVFSVFAFVLSAAAFVLAVHRRR
jgi:hypothetical protein